MDIAKLTPEQIAQMDAEDRLHDDPTDGIDWEEIIADWDAEQRGERPSIRIESPEHMRALVDDAERRRLGRTR